MSVKSSVRPGEGKIQEYFVFQLGDDSSLGNLSIQNQVHNFVYFLDKLNYYFGNKDYEVNKMIEKKFSEIKDEEKLPKYEIYNILDPNYKVGGQDLMIEEERKVFEEERKELEEIITKASSKFQTL